MADEVKQAAVQLVEYAADQAEAILNKVKNDERAVLGYKKLLLTTLILAQSLSRDVSSDITNVKASTSILALLVWNPAQPAAAEKVTKDGYVTSMYDGDIIPQE